MSKSNIRQKSLAEVQPTPNWFASCINLLISKAGILKFSKKKCSTTVQIASTGTTTITSNRAYTRREIVKWH